MKFLNQNYQKGMISTLNGLLHEKLQDIPQEGDKLELEKIRIVVEKVVKNLPIKIRIERIKK